MALLGAHRVQAIVLVVPQKLIAEGVQQVLQLVDRQLLVACGQLSEESLVAVVQRRSTIRDR